MVHFHRCLLHWNKCVSGSRQLYFDSTMSKVLKKHYGQFLSQWERGYIGWPSVYKTGWYESECATYSYVCTPQICHYLIIVELHLFGIFKWYYFTNCKPKFLHTLNKSITLDCFNSMFQSKTALIRDLIADNKIDILALPETGLPSDIHPAIKCDTAPPG